MTKRLARHWALFLLALAIASGCAGDGCACVAPIPGGFPTAERSPDRIQLRVTRGGLDAIEADPAALIEALLGSMDGLTFDVPPSCPEGPGICCEPPNGPPQQPCGPIEIDLAEQPGDPPRLELTPVPGENRLDVTVRARVRTVEPLSLFDVALGADCEVSLDSGASGEPSVRIEVGVNLVQDPVLGTTRIETGEIAVEQVDNGDIDLTGGFLCVVGDLFIGLFKGQLIDGVSGVLRDLLDEAACKPCPSGDVAECGAGADACTAGICTVGDQCVQELGIAGRLDAAGLLGAFGAGVRSELDLYAVAGGYADSDNDGLSLGVLSGALAGSTAGRCGPPAQPPPAATAPRSPFFTGNTRPDDNSPFDIGIGVHQSFLDQFAFAAYESGLLCLNVGTPAVGLLNSDTLSILFPSVNDLLNDGTAQIFVGLRPQSPPRLPLGAGTTTPEGDIDEPLLGVAFDGLELDFFAQVDGQFIRLMTATTDLTLPVNLDVTGDGEIEPVLGDIEDGFQNIAVKNSEALRESPEDLAARLPAVLAIAAPFLGDALGSFALPELAGLQIALTPNGITAVDDEAFLGIFGDLELAGDSLAPDRVETRARVVSEAIPATDAFRAPERYADQRPALELEMEGRRADGTSDDLEFSYRIDRGMWSPYRPQRRVVISSAGFWLQGKHRIEVRAREAGQPLTADPTPALLTHAIDTLPPAVKVLRLAADEAWIVPRDNVSLPTDVVVGYRLPGTEWTEVLGGPVRVDLAGHPVEELELRLTDEVGNVTEGPGVVLAFHGEAESGGGCECSTTGSAGSGSLALLLLSSLLLGGRRRWRAIRLWCRRHGLVAAAALAAAVAPAGCSCGSTADGPPLPECDGPCQEGAVEPGPTGRFASLATDGSRTIVTGYEQAWGDLVVVDVRDGAAASTWFIDGLPDEPATFDPTTYRTGIAGRGPNVGGWTSAALANGEVRVAYYDFDNEALKFAFEEGDRQYTVHTVDSEPGSATGLYTSLALDAEGRPSVAYHVAAIADGSGGFASELRLATASSDRPAAASDWTIDVIDRQPISCAGLCDTGDACLADANTCATPTDDCAEECGEGFACFAAECVAVQVPLEASRPPIGTGLFNTLLFDDSGAPLVVAYDSTTTDLLLFRREGDTWTRAELDADPATDRGQFASAALDDGGTLHVAYQDALLDQLRYLQYSDGSVTVTEVVDDGTRDDRPHSVGAGAALALADGEPVVVYQDGTTADAIAARRSGTAWTRSELLSGDPLAGFFLSLAPTGANVVGVSFVYDRATFPPGQLEFFSAP